MSDKKKRKTYPLPPASVRGDDLKRGPLPEGGREAIELRDEDYAILGELWQQRAAQESGAAALEGEIEAEEE